MKKKHKNKASGQTAPVNPKGKKLSYAPLRALVLDTLENNPSSWNARQLIKKLKIANSKVDVLRVLDALVKQGKAQRIAEDDYRASKTKVDTSRRATPIKTPGGHVMTGKVDMTRSGAAYVVVEELEDDIFVSQKHTGGAMHRDTVEVEMLPVRKGKRPEGRIVGIVKRALEQVIGTLKMYKKFAVVVPDRVTIQFDLVVPIDKLNEAVDGDKVVVKITDWSQASPSGEVVHVIGASGSHELEMQSILINNGFNLAWPEQVLHECRDLPETITEEEIALRKDFRNVTTFTIDPITAKDFDDALSIQTLENGNTEVGIHIADVSHYVKPGTALDKEAYLRSTSVYLVDRVCPMLPEKLSNELCSLRPLEESLCYSAVFEFDAGGKIADKWFGRTVIFSDHRFSYEDAQVVIDTGEGPFAEEVRKLNKMARALRKKRIKDGAIMLWMSWARRLRYLSRSGKKPIC
jgi:ribonuclease R